MLISPHRRRLLLHDESYFCSSSPEADLARRIIVGCMRVAYCFRCIMNGHLVSTALAAASKEPLAHLTCSATCSCERSEELETKSSD